MKKLIALLTVAATLATASVYAQGTIAFLNSDGTAVKFAPDAAKVFGTADLATIPTAVSAQFKASLYYSKTEGGAMSKFVDANFSTLGKGGKFNGGTVTIPDIGPDVEGWFQVKVWEVKYGNSYENCLTAAAIDNRLGVAGQSSVFKLKLGSATTPGQLSSVMSSFTVSVVPEPSAFALGLLGLAGLFVLRRRS